jgi:hypothetical protein
MATVFLSRLTNIRLGLSVVFVSGTEVWRRMGGDFLCFLLENWGHVVHAQDKVATALADVGLDGDSSVRALRDPETAPVWWRCGCGRRAHLIVTPNSLTLHGSCRVCERTIELPFLAVEEEVAAGKLLPRVGTLNLLEGVATELAAGVSYMSGGLHCLSYALVSQKLGLASLPQLFLSIEGEFCTPPEVMFKRGWWPKGAVGVDEARKLIQSGKGSSIYYLTRSNTELLRSGIRQWVEADLDGPVMIE